MPSSNRLLDILFEQASIGLLLVCHRTKRLTRVNQSLCQLLGHSPDELAATTLQDITHPDDLAESMKCMETALRGDTDVIRTEVRYIHKTGSIVWASICTFSLQPVGLEPNHCLVFVEDTSKYKATEAALREKEFILRSTTDRMRAVFTIYDRIEDRVLYVNSAYTQIFGKTTSSLYENANSWLEAVHSDDRPRLIAALHEAKINGANFDETFDVLQNDGSLRTVHGRSFPIPDEFGVVRIDASLAEDVTQSQIAQIQLSEIRDELAHVSRISILNEVASGLAHEINQPLGALSLYAYMAIEHARSVNDPILTELLEKIRGTTLRAGEIIRHVLSFAQRGGTFRQPICVNRVVEAAIRIVKVNLEMRSININLKLHDAVPMVQADCVQIQQVLVNLITNACDSMRDVPNERKKMTITTGLCDIGVRVKVVDSGLGLTSSSCDELFQPFRSSKPGGLGIGLAISRRLIDAHGGQIAGFANPVHGMTFYFDCDSPRLSDSGGSTNSRR